MVTEKEQGNTDELEANGDEIERLKQDKEALTRELKTRDATIIRFEQTLAGKDSEIVALKQAFDEAERKRSGGSSQSGGACRADNRGYR